MKQEGDRMAHIIGNRIRQLRKAKGMTQQQLAAVERLKTSQASLAAYETGAREPSADTINRLTDYFGVTTDDLFGRTDIKAAEQIVALSSTMAERLAQIAEIAADCKSMIEQQKGAITHER